MASSFSEVSACACSHCHYPKVSSFSRSERAAIGSYYSTVAPGTFLPQAFHGLRCRTWVDRVVLTAHKSLPVYPDKRTISEPVGMSQRCHELLLAVVATVQTWPHVHVTTSSKPELISIGHSS